MRFHATGLIVFGVIVLLALFAGAVPAVAILRVALVLYVVAAFLEVAVNMLFQSTFSPLEGFAHWRGPQGGSER
jgi:hypothetical protein